MTAIRFWQFYAKKKKKRFYFTFKSFSIHPADSVQNFGSAHTGITGSNPTRASLLDRVFFMVMCCLRILGPSD